MPSTAIILSSWRGTPHKVEAEEAGGHTEQAERERRDGARPGYREAGPGDRARVPDGRWAVNSRRAVTPLWSSRNEVLSR
jgi:hypothetical protein